MSYFDPIKTRRNLEEFSLKFDRNLGEQQPPAHGSFLKGMVSTSVVTTLIKACLVGLDEETIDIAERTQLWLQEAIDEGECTTDRQASDADWHQQDLSEALALVKFLRGQGVDRKDFSRSASLIERAWRTRVPPFDNKTIAEGQLEPYMTSAYSGCLYSDAIRNFEEYHPGTQPNVQTVRSQRGVGYLLCQHKLLGLHGPDTIRMAVKRLLDVHLQEKWLGAGLHRKALHWLMIAYAEDTPNADPREVVLRAYDHMPKVQRPDWLR